MSKCQAIKANGQRCERIVSGSESYCYSHDPQRKAERSRNASKAARTKNGTELTEIKDEIRRIVKDVESDKLKTSKASIMIQGLGSLRYFIELERRIKEEQELQEIQERLDAIEARANQRVRGV